MKRIELNTFFFGSTTDELIAIENIREKEIKEKKLIKKFPPCLVIGIDGEILNYKSCRKKMNLETIVKTCPNWFTWNGEPAEKYACKNFCSIPVHCIEISCPICGGSGKIYQKVEKKKVQDCIDEINNPKRKEEFYIATETNLAIKDHWEIVGITPKMELICRIGDIWKVIPTKPETEIIKIK